MKGSIWLSGIGAGTVFRCWGAIDGGTGAGAGLDMSTGSKICGSYWYGETSGTDWRAGAGATDALPQLFPHEQLPCDSQPQLGDSQPQLGAFISQPQPASLDDRWNNRSNSELPPRGRRASAPQLGSTPQLGSAAQLLQPPWTSHPQDGVATSHPQVGPLISQPQDGPCSEHPQEPWVASQPQLGDAISTPQLGSFDLLKNLSNNPPFLEVHGASATSHPQEGP
ncbi:MAG: hypothetical protein AB8B50_21435 [Pirellulaceae bacterium]